MSNARSRGAEMVANAGRLVTQEVSVTPAILPSFIDFGRETCCSLEAGTDREWLVANGIGGFASGTVAGLSTRRYHGLLVAALKPPLGRTLLVAKLEEIAQYSGAEYLLFTDRWADGTVSPQGYVYLERFRLEGATPVWTFAFADARLEKRIWMQISANTTFVQYSLTSASGPVHLHVKALVNYRDFHASTHSGDWRMNVEQVERGLRVVAFDGATPFCLLSTSASAGPSHVWYRDFDLSVERERGLEDREDHLHAGTFCATLQEGESVTIVCSTESSPELDGSTAYKLHLARQNDLLDDWAAVRPELAKVAPLWIKQLVLAADVFVVKRPLKDEPDACSVIAGYHWFGDWGRDTMVALPGLALATGRPQLARSILRTFSRFVDSGMVPNVFPDTGETPEYNTVDATLWYFEALRQYLAATGDTQLLKELFPTLSQIIEWHQKGTRFGIRVDPNDGLLYAGQSGVQLTWMDAKVGDWVVTPRIGKPVEVNALWLNALVTMAQFAGVLGSQAETYELLAKSARHGFKRFWNESANYCFDVIDGPEPGDSSLRPNQILAVSLPECPFTAEQQRAIVDACARRLLTSHGLRSLAPGHRNYQGRYAGGPRERDGTYHQGTVWGWLLGPFVLAHLRVYGDPIRAAAFLEPFANHLRTAGLGSASEIFDGDAPFVPRGCIAQAWTVAELLRAWTGTASAALAMRPQIPQEDASRRLGPSVRPRGAKIKDAPVRK